MGSRSVADLMQASGPLPARDAAQIGAEVCRVLEGLHASVGPLGAISASTVMLLPGHKVSLAESTAPAGEAEFGASRALFAAPELLEGGPLTRAADIYSVGALIHHMVTGSYLVEGGSTAEVREAHRRGDVRRLDSARVGLPREMVAAVERAMASDPAARFPDAASMKASLQASVAPRARAQVSTPSPSAPAKRPWLIWFLAADAVVMIVVAAFLIPRFLRAGPSGGSDPASIDGADAAIPAAHLSDSEREALASLSTRMRSVEPLGAHDAARRMSEEALQIAESAMGQAAPQLAPIMEDAAFACLAAGDYLCAQTRYEQALALREKVRGGDQSPRARTMLGMALLLEESGNAAGAARLRQEAAQLPGWDEADPLAPYRVDLTLLAGGSSGRMAADSPLEPDDKLGLELTVNRTASLYVIDEDAEGGAYLLYPLPAYETRNPLPAGVPIRLPGKVQGRDRHWLMTGALEGQRLLLVVSPEPLEEIEAEVRGVPAASQEGRPILASRISDNGLNRLRSLADPGASRGRLFSKASRPTIRSEPARGVWIRAVGNNALAR